MYMNSREPIFRAFYLPPIAVTSPDQFVPLWLSGISPTKPKAREEYKRVIFQNGMDLLVPESSPLHENPRVGGRGNTYPEDLKKELMKLFDIPYPKSYAMPLDTRRVIPLSKSEPVIRERIESLGIDFSGSSDYPTGAVSYIALPGYIGRYTIPKSFTIGTATYEQELAYWMVNPIAIMHLLVVLVKAKHIPAIRASKMLNGNYSIPDPDMMVVKTDWNRDDDLHIQRAINESGFRHFLDENEREIKVISHDELDKYLIGEGTRVDRTAYLEKARKIARGELQLADVNV